MGHQLYVPLGQLQAIQPQGCSGSAPQKLRTLYPGCLSLATPGAASPVEPSSGAGLRLFCFCCKRQTTRTHSGVVSPADGPRGSSRPTERGLWRRSLAPDGAAVTHQTPSGRPGNRADGRHPARALPSPAPRSGALASAPQRRCENSMRY